VSWRKDSSPSHLSDTLTHTLSWVTDSRFTNISYCKKLIIHSRGPNWQTVHRLNRQTRIDLTPTSLTRVNLEHISSASAILPARNMYLAHLELMYRSAMSSDCASSSQCTASLISPACCNIHKLQTFVLTSAQSFPTAPSASLQLRTISRRQYPRN